MVRVVLHVPGGHVLEKSAIFSKDVVRPGPDLLSAPLHYPRALILQPWLTPWEEVQTHVHQYRWREIVRNGLHPRCDFWIRQVGIDIDGHQELVRVRSIPDGHSDILYGRGVARGNITPRDILLELYQEDTYVAAPSPYTEDPRLPFHES